MPDADTQQDPQEARGGMRPYLPTVLRVTLGLFLVLTSAVILYMTEQNTRSAESLADRTLQNTAVALAASAEGVLYRGGSQAVAEIREIFSDRVVAYARIMSRDGELLFHTNPLLVGSRVAPDVLNRSWPTSGFLTRRILLGTGLPAYEFNHAIHRPDGGAVLLTLVLHTGSVDRIVADARRMWWMAGGVLVFLGSIGILSERVFIRHVRWQAELQGREQLALIGQMTAVLAHEIRNALGSMKGYAQWVDEKLERTDPRKAGLSVVLQGVGRIETLVDDLLLFSREESFHLESLEPACLVEEVLRSVTLSWRGRVKIDARPQTFAVCDREKLRRVLWNGIRNAIQAMGEKGELRIEVRAEGRWVEIRIEDSGPGIPSEEIPRLFTPFHTTKTDGTGLGLAYSRKVMEGMKGRIELSNRVGQTGAVLTAVLPRAKG